MGSRGGHGPSGGRDEPAVRGILASRGLVPSRKGAIHRTKGQVGRNGEIPESGLATGLAPVDNS